MKWYPWPVPHSTHPALHTVTIIRTGKFWWKKVEIGKGKGHSLPWKIRIKWNMKRSQKPIQKLIILSRIGRPCVCGKRMCEPVNFLFWELSYESFIHSPFNNVRSLQLLYLAPQGFCCVGWDSRNQGPWLTAGRCHSDGEGRISSLLHLPSLALLLDRPGLKVFPWNPKPCQSH